MTHRCLKCSTLHQDMVMMCNCGSTAFFFQRAENPSAPADTEGKYTIDVAALLGAEISEEAEGKYTIDLPTRLQRKK